MEPEVLRIRGESGGGDCLHYFLPSVVDGWVYALFNLMK